MCDQIKAVSFSRGVFSPGSPPGTQAQVMAAPSLPVGATTLGKSDLTEVVTASTRGSFENRQLLLWQFLHHSKLQGIRPLPG